MMCAVFPTFRPTLIQPLDKVKLTILSEDICLAVRYVVCLVVSFHSPIKAAPR